MDSDKHFEVLLSSTVRMYKNQTGESQNQYLIQILHVNWNLISKILSNTH